MARYVIFTQSLFTERDWHRFGCQEFRDNGYEIVCVEVASALGIPDKVRSQGVFQSIRAIVAPQDFAALENIVLSLTKDDVVLMQVMLSDPTRHFFKVLYRHNVVYAAATMGPVPIFRMKRFRSALSLQEYVALKIADARSMLSRAKASLVQIAGRGLDYFQLQSPTYWLAVGAKPPAFALYWPRLSGARRISVPSYDYTAARQVPAARAVSEKTAVFIDEAFPDHPDFQALGRRSPVTRERYWASLERLFKSIEAQTGLSVVIAPHPKSNGANPEINVRRWIAGKVTGEVIRDCALVISHSSTAVSFGVIFRKPIMFVTTDEVEASPYRAAIARISSCFGHRRINADRFADADLQVPLVDEAVYQSYEREYLRGPDAIEGSPWAALRNEMKKNER